MKSKILSIILAIALLAGGMATNVQPVQAAVTINNGDFETGNLTGWTIQKSAFGSAIATNSFNEATSAYTIVPAQGNYYALLKPYTNGVYTIISQPFRADAGDWVSGLVNFGSEDYLPYDDIGQVRILDTAGNPVAVPFYATSSIMGGIRKTGWVQWAHKFTADGTYSVEAKVTNIGDNYRSSVIGLDQVSNVPFASPFSLTLPVLPSGSGSVVATDAQGNTLSATNGVISDLAAGAVVNLTATPAPGYVFSGWAGSGHGTTPNISVTMDSNKTVITSFMPLSYTLSWSTSGSGTITATANGVSVASGASVAWGSQVSLTAAPANGWSFQGWSGSLTSTSQNLTTYITSNFSVVGTFVQSNYNLTITNSGSGSGEVTLSNNGPVYHYGDTLQLTAIPEADSYFGGWGGALSGNTNPATITIYGSYTINAEFIEIPASQYIINVTASGQGSIVITNPQGQIVTNGSSVDQGTVLTLTPVSAAGWTFSAWSGAATGNTTPLSLTMDANKSITAAFTQNVYTLTTTSTGSGSGSVLKNNPGPYHYGDVVQLTAEPAANSIFAGWGGALNGTTNPANVTISDDTVVTASFNTKPLNEVTLTVNVSGSGSVTKNPDHPSYIYDPAQGAVFVTLTAVPAQGWTFSAWSGDANGTNPSYSIVMDANKNVTATFVQNTTNTFTVTVGSAGNGTAGINQNGTIVTSGTYPAGTQISLVATPATGYKFSGWSGGVSGTTSPLTVTVSGNLNVTANFTILTFTMTTFVSGSGTVTGNLAPVYSYGETVTLTANPVTGWVFSNWSGDATGNANPLSIIMTSPKSITAVFSQINPNPYTITVNTVGNGSVTLTPNSTGYASGAAVTLQAIPVAGSVFTRWSGAASGSLNPVIVTVTGNLTITANFTGISLSSTPNPSVYGQSVVLTAGVTTDAGVGTAATGTFQLTVDGSNSGAPVPLTNGSATLTVNTLNVGTHILAVVYSGDTKYSAGTSQTISQGVNKANTSTTLDSTNSGLSFTFTAAVNPVAPGAGTIGGNVVFNNGATVLGTQPVVSGQAVLTVTLPSGGITVTAQYAGDTNFNTSSAFFIVPAIKIESSLALTASPNPSTFGSPVTFTATASGAGVIPSGNVEFKDGNTSLGTQALDAAGKAQLTISTLSAGTHAVTASYAGDTLYNGSQAGLSQVVNLTSSIILSVDTNPSVFGQEVTFTATASGIAAGQNLTFKDGSVTLGSAALDAAGKAVYKVSNLTVATHNITAVYSQTTSNSLEQIVNKADTSVELSASLANGNYSFTAVVKSVTPGSGIPSGTVTFLDGTAPLGGAVQLSASGQAVLSVALTGGQHSITAQYNGNSNYNTSTSDPLVETVRTSSVQLTSSLNPANFGSSVAFTATVSGSDAANAPYGTVTFKDGATVLTTVNLGDSGVAAYSTSTLSSGTHNITVQYSGDTNYPAASAALSQTVNKVATTTTLTSSVNPSTIGQSVNFTAQVSDSSPTANSSGTVTFYDATTSIGTATLDAMGKAVLTISNLTEGDHEIKAVYAGDNNFNASTSADLTQTVKNSCTRNYLLHIMACGGTVTISPRQCTFAPGTVVTLTAVARSGYTFVRWEGDLDGTTNPTTITMDSDKFVKAVFTENHPSTGYTLTTSVSGQGSITVNPAQATYTKYSKVTLTAVPAAGYRFYKWQGDLCGDDNTETILMTENKEITAVFKAVNATENYTLTVTVVGSGTVTKDPDQATYAKYTNVNLKAIPAAGFTFDKWQGDLDGRDSTESIRMTGNEQVTAVFKAANTSGYTLSVTVVGSGTVTKDPDQATYAKYTNVNLKAIPAAGYTFDKWQGDLWGDDATQSIRMTDDKQITAVFKAANTSGYTLTVTVVGSGTVTKDPDQATYAKYTNVNLKAIPAAGYTFDKWQGDLCGDDATQSIRMTENMQVTAVFKANAASGYTLAVTIVGSGTVTKDPDQATYAKYSWVNLKAVPAAGYTFDKWQGDLWGDDNSEHIFMTENKEVTAVFKTVPSTTTTLTSSLNPANPGANVTFTATVNGNSPTGSVTFKDGSSVLGSGFIFFGKAMYTTNDLTAGSHSITAVYSGDSRNSGSTSAVLTQVISAQKINTTTTLTVPTSPTAAGKAVITARVQPVSGNGTPTGSVSFYNGSTKLGDAQLINSVATLNSTNLAAGSYSIKATYNGSSSYNSSSSSTSIAFILYQDCQFVIWGGNPGGIKVGSSYNFWGSQWEKQVKSGNYPGNFSFKGFANNVDDNNNKWSTDPGNSCQPPSSIGKYISVIVTKNFSKYGSNLKGEINQVVLVKVDDPGYYQSNPGHSCNGTVIGIIR